MNINSLQNIILSAPYFAYLSSSALLFENIAEIPPQISSILLQNIAFYKPFPEIKVKDRNPCLYFNSTGQQYFLNDYSVLFMLVSEGQVYENEYSNQNYVMVRFDDEKPIRTGLMSLQMVLVLMFS